MSSSTSNYGATPLTTVDINERACAPALSVDEEAAVAPLRRAADRRAYVRLLVGTCASVALVVAAGSGAARGSASPMAGEEAGAGGARGGVSPAAVSEFRAAGDVEYDSTDLYKWFNMSDPEQKLVCNIGYKVLKNCMVPSEFDDVSMLIACEQHGWAAYNAFCSGVDFSGNATTTDSADSVEDSNADSESAASATTATTAGATLVAASSTGRASAFTALALLDEKAAQWRDAAPEEREAHRRLHGVAHAFVCSEIETGYGVCLDHDVSFDGMSCDTWSTAIYEFMCIDGATNTINGNI